MPKRTTTEKGLGSRHQAAVEWLLLIHKDGTTCDWCGKPMFRDPTKNPDYDESEPDRRGNGMLQGDHSIKSRKDSLKAGEKVLPPDRLLHGECNRSRGAGLNDHLSFTHKQVTDIQDSLLPWPWKD